jgi:hypothetical protein
MNTIDLKSLVEQSVKQEWPDFAASHPRLAQVLNEELIVDSATSSLQDDPVYQETLTKAAAAGMAADALGDIVGKLVRKFFQSLL